MSVNIKGKTHIVFQYLAAIAANILNISYGTTIAWYSSNSAKLQTVDSPLQVPPLEKSEVLWIGASQYIGAIVGTGFLSIMGDGFGRKNTLCMLVIPQLASWMLIMFSTNATELYMARLLSGFVGGGSIILTMLYIAELAEDKYRGVLLSLLPFFINFGILTEFAADFFLSFREVTYIIVFILAVFIVMLSIFPDTPKHLYKINRTKEAIKSLQWYRNTRELAEQTPDYYRVEVKKIKNILRKEVFTLEDFRSTASVKAFVLAILFIVLHSFCNCFIVAQYSSNLYMHWESFAIPEKLSKIFISFIQVFGAFICTLFIDRIGRRALLMISIIGTAVGLLFYGFYSYSFSIEQTAVHANLFSIAWYTCILFFSSCGIIPLIYIILPEIFSNKIRDFGLTITFTLLWCLEFILIHYSESIFTYLKIHNYAFLLASYSLVYLILAFFILPETKRKSFDEVLDLMSSW